MLLAKGKKENVTAVKGVQRSDAAAGDGRHLVGGRKALRTDDNSQAGGGGKSKAPRGRRDLVGGAFIQARRMSRGGRAVATWRRALGCRAPPW